VVQTTSLAKEKGGGVKGSRKRGWLGGFPRKNESQISSGAAGQKKKNREKKKRRKEVSRVRR